MSSHDAVKDSVSRTVRYQGAIVRDGQVLLIQHRLHDCSQCFWLLPGGGQGPGESAEECVAREMREETGLEVAVERLLLTYPELEFEGRVYGLYSTLKTYLCTPTRGEARPGYEPEPEAAADYAIAAVAWFDLRSPELWLPEVRADSITFPQLQAVGRELGYDSA